MKTYLFYDLETTGLNPSFDQVLTFAGVRTDMQLCEIDRTCLTIRLRKDIIPAPRAFVTHCLTLDAVDAGMCEYDAAQDLHRLFNTPDTISVGYNSLGFDDEFLRFMFYRNLLDPYSHQYAGGCSRADILPVAALCKIFCEKVMRWPCLEDGRSTLKLAHISRENDFATSGPAHDAMADVEALVALCRIFSGQADIWAYAMGFFNKHTDLSRLAAMPQDCRIEGQGFCKAIMVSASFGPDAGYMAPVLHIGDAVPYKNQQLWIRLDRPEGMEIDPETGCYTWMPIRKKPADQWILLPELDRFQNRLSPEARETAAGMIHTFRTQPQRFFDTVQAHLAYVYPAIPDLDPDAALYQDGFFSAAEKKEMARFHGAGPFQSKGVTAEHKVLDTLHSPRIKTLAARILMRNFNTAPDAQFHDHLKGLKAGAKIVGYRNDEKYTLARAMAQLEKLESEYDGLDRRQQQALDQVKAYLHTWQA
jgi:exodeoxyribonuclease I